MEFDEEKAYEATSDDLVGELLPLVREMKDWQTSVHGKMLGYMDDAHVKSYNVVFFNYPATGSLATLDAGDTVLDFRAGTVKIPDGTVSKMSSNLRDKQKDFLRSASIYSNRDIAIQFDEDDKSPVFADHFLNINHQQFTKITLTATEATKVIVSVSTSPDTHIESIADRNISIEDESVPYGVDKVYTIRTDKDLHFTGALAQYESEEENIPGLVANKIKVLRARALCDQQLNFRLWLWGNDTFDSADLDNDRYQDYIDCDFTHGVQYKNTGKWYKDLPSGIYYQDFDGTKELHIAIENLSATSKNAGASGEIVIELMYAIMP